MPATLHVQQISALQRKPRRYLNPWLRQLVGGVVGLSVLYATECGDAARSVDGSRSQDWVGFSGVCSSRSAFSVPAAAGQQDAHFTHSLHPCSGARPGSSARVSLGAAHAPPRQCTAAWFYHVVLFSMGGARFPHLVPSHSPMCVPLALQRGAARDRELHEAARLATHSGRRVL